MTNEDKPDPEFEAGVEALAKGLPEAPSEYPKSASPGNVIARCKTDGCTSAIDFGFCYDTSTWIEEFKPVTIECPSCKQEHRYSSTDLVPVPSKS